MNSVVKTTGLTKKVKGKQLVSNINLHIHKGEIYGLLGKNGAGKTTIMKMLAGLMRPTSGEIELFGQRFTNSSRFLLKRVGSIIEYPIFYEHLTAIDNLKIHCEYLGYYDNKGIKQALDLVQLRGVEGKYVNEFSLGMKQRLGIARAIITKPELIIFDEPINGLDPIGIKDTRDLILMLNKEYGITFILSSHILGEMELVIDRMGVIDNGMLLDEVTLEDIRKERTDFVELLTTDVQKTLYLLENELHISNMKIIRGDRIRIYDLTYSQSDISKLLITNDIGIEEIQKHTSSLEDYFYEKFNGGENNV